MQCFLLFKLCFFPLTISRILAVGSAAPPATATIGTRGVERVVAIIRQVAFLSVTTSAPGSTRGRTVPNSNLTELLVNLEALEAQLLHFLQGRGRTDVDGEGFIACNLTYGLLTSPSTPLPQHILFYFNPCCAPHTKTVCTIVLLVVLRNLALLICLNILPPRGSSVMFSISNG